jgi:hypothetical protein
MTMRKFLALGLLLGCNGSGAAKQDEHKKWDAYQSTIAEVFRLRHECDPEEAAREKVSAASSEADHVHTSRLLAVLSSGGGLPNERVRDDLRAENEKAEAYVIACFKRQSDYVEGDGKSGGAHYYSTSTATQQARSDRLRDAGDGWLDACVKCAAPQACIDRWREAARLKGDAVKGYSKPPLCQ